MKQYFIDKLKDSLSQLESTQNSILSEVANGNFRTLTALSNSALQHKQTIQNLVKDLPKYCSVDEVIEISNTKANYSSDDLLLTKNINDLEYAYKYNSKPIRISERDKLVERFGYRLKEAKV
jgi:hypothetical protein